MIMKSKDPSDVFTKTDIIDLMENFSFSMVILGYEAPIFEVAPDGTTSIFFFNQRFFVNENVPESFNELIDYTENHLENKKKDYTQKKISYEKNILKNDIKIMEVVDPGKDLLQ